MVTSLATTNQKKYFQTVIPIESFDVHEVQKAQALFSSYKSQKIILDGDFNDDVWHFCDEYEQLGMDFHVSDLTYTRCYKSIFGIGINRMKDYLKTFIMMSLGKNVLKSIRDVLNDAKELFNTRPDKVSEIEFRRPNALLDLLELLPVVDEEAKDDIMEQLEACSEVQMQKYTYQRRNLAEFDSYFCFNDLLEQYWNRDLSSDVRLFFYPLYLWWRVTTILPLRPREFLLTPRDCISERNGKCFLTIRRNNLKGGSGVVHYNLNLDYRKETYEIPKQLYQLISYYIDQTKDCEENVIKTLLRAEPHYSRFHHVKPYTSRFYTYVNLACCLRIFYADILVGKMGYSIVSEGAERGKEEIEFIHLADTRHVAMINLILQGGTPTLAMLLAGHADITISSHYYANISSLVACQTYSMYRKRLSRGQGMVVGKNFNTPNVKELDYVPIENGARCYSPQFFVGDISDCVKATGDYAEIGYCYRCPYYRKMDAAYFSETEDVYKSLIDKDSLHLKSALQKYRNGLGYQEDVHEALLKLQSSSSTYQHFRMQRNLYQQEVTQDGTT